MSEALLFSRDENAIRMFRRVYQELDIRLEVQTAAEPAQVSLQEKRFDAVVIDCDEVPEGPEVLRSVRSSAANRRTMTLALLDGLTKMRGAFDLGANLTLQKPLSTENVRKTLRVLHAMAEREYQRYYRVPVDVQVTLTFDEQQELKAMATNISEGGMALRLEQPMPEHRAASVRFMLPGSPSRVEAKISVAWTDANGAAGVRFEFIAPAERHELNAWLLRNMELPAQPSLPEGEPVPSKSLR